MENTPAFSTRDDNGAYTATRPVTAEEILNQANKILRQKFKRGTTIGSPADTREYLKLQLAGKESEAFCAIYLDNRHRIIVFAELFRGTIDACAVYPREVVKKALSVNAAALILAHNHPSGVPEPSQSDQVITRRIREALEIVDVRLLDHFVVGGGEAVSLASRGML